MCKKIIIFNRFNKSSRNKLFLYPEDTFYLTKNESNKKRYFNKNNNT